MPPMRMACAISGMVAVHAKQAVFTALAGVPGIVRAEVELGQAEVWCAPGFRLEALREAVEAVGCQVTGVRYLRDDLPTLLAED